MKTLVLGLGNPLRCDDGVGIKVAEAVRKKISCPEVEVVETDTSGFGLLDLLLGYEQAIIIDAIQTSEGSPGQVYRLGLEDLAPSQPTLTHSVDLPAAIKFGRELGLPMPEEVIIFAVEAQDVTTFSEQCTSKVRQAIPKVVDLVLHELKSN